MSHERSHDFLDALKQQKSGHEVRLDHLPNNESTGKIRDYLDEIKLLDTIYPDKDSLPKYDESVGGDPDLQIDIATSKMVRRLFDLSDTTDELAGISMRMVNRKAGESTILSRMTANLRLAMIDLQCLYTEGIKADSEANGDLAGRNARVRESYQNVWWMAMLHGKHDPMLKEHMGRTDSESMDTRSYYKGFFIPNEKNVLLDIPRLEEVVQSFPEAETVRIGCPAAYTPVLKNVWNLVCDIYEECELRQNQAGSGTI